MCSKKKFFAALFFITLVAGSFVGADASAQSFVDALQKNLTKTFQAAGIAPTPDVQLEDIAVNLINVALSIIGVVFTGLLIYGGWLYMTAAGSQDRIEQGVKTMQRAVIGIAIVAASLSISFFVTRSIVESTGGVFFVP
jgi:hypothetical protein